MKPCPVCNTPAAYESDGLSYCSYGHVVGRRFGQTDDVQVSELAVEDLDDKLRAVYERWEVDVMRTVVDRFDQPM